AAREADLATVMAVAAGPFRQDDPGDSLVVGIDQGEHTRRACRTIWWRALTSPKLLVTADDDRRQHGRRCRQRVGQIRQPLDDEVEAHDRPTTRPTASSAGRRHPPGPAASAPRAARRGAGHRAWCPR